MPVSVLIVTRNRPEFLRFVLSQLAERVRPEDEVIVIDDGSELSAEPAVEVLDEKCHCRFVRHDEHVGYIARRNQGILMASHECILQLDDDSWPVEADALSRCEDALQDHPDVGAFALPIHYHWSAAPDGCGSLSKRWRAPHLARECAFMGCGVVLRRSAVQSAGLYPDYYGYGWEETALCVRLHRCGYKTRMCRRIRVIHGHEALSQSRSYSATRALDPGAGILANRLCLLRETFAPPLAILGAAGIYANAAMRGYSFSVVKGAFQDRAPLIKYTLRLSPVQAFHWLFLWMMIGLRRRVDICRHLTERS